MKILSDFCAVSIMHQLTRLVLVTMMLIACVGCDQRTGIFNLADVALLVDDGHADEYAMTLDLLSQLRIPYYVMTGRAFEIPIRPAGFRGIVAKYNPPVAPARQSLEFSNLIAGQ